MSLQFFVADDGSTGQELWVTDGSVPGTFRLRDINPGLGGANIANLVQSNGIMYFTAYDGAATHLWRSDGTGAGTYALSSSANGDNAGNLFNVNGRMFFTGSDSVHGAGLFVSDGTVGGTQFVAAVSNPSGFITVGNSLFFTASDATHGTELWKSDGTAAGTVMVKDVLPGSGSSTYANFTALDGKLYFTANDATHGTEVWVSDGTDAGTFQLKDINLGASGSGAGNFFAAAGHVYFTANDGAHGTQFYATDGTSANTGVLTLSTGQSITPVANTQIVFNHTYYYVGTDPAGGRAIYTSDGTSLTKVLHLSSFSGKFYNLGSKLIFSGNDGTHGTGLYAWDGTTLSFVSSTPGGLSQQTVSNGKLFFVSSDSAHGSELWVTDGTAAGTHITADINPGAYNADIANISAVGGGVAFTATRPDVGTELFFSDGTAAGTGLLSNVNPTGNHSPSFSFSNVVQAGGLGFFAGNDGINGPELWVTDGSVNGSHMVADTVFGSNGANPRSFVAAGGKIFFTADDGVNGRQLYTSDGTTLTQLTSNGLDALYDDSNRFFTLNGKLYFMGFNAGGAYTLFQSDGTVAGTTVAYQFINGNSYSSPIRVGSKIYMMTNDGVHGGGLYSFDGASLTFIASVGDYEEPVVSGNNLFWRSYDGGNGRELWVSDGTTAGTHMVGDINPGPYDSSPTNLIGLGNGSVVFSAYNPATGTELYVSNGTTVSLLKDVNATGNHGQSLNINSNLATAGSLTFFAGEDGIHGNELWVSDGTTGNTHMVADLQVGGNSSNPSSFWSVGGKIFFTADDGANGRQLYTSDGSTVTQLTSNGVDTLYADAGRFFTLNNKFYFMGYDPAGGFGLFTSNGTVAGTQLVSHINFDTPIKVGSFMVLHGNDDVHGNGIYRFDGTGAPTLIANVGGYDYQVASGGNLFWRSSDGGAGNELWVTDGTTAGTHLVKDINPGPYDASIDHITSLGNGSVVFTAFNPATGNEVYVSNGTAAGTTLLKDVNQTGNHSQYLNINTDPVAAGALTFFAGEDGVHGNELWVTDGTTGGSHMVTDLVVGGNPSNPNGFTSAGGKIFFMADDGTGRQLYTSNGTTMTQLTFNGTDTVYPDSARFFVLNNKIFFMTYDPAGGGALYTSDGTVAGTQRIAHMNFDTSIKLGTTVILRGNDDVHGQGLYAFDGTNAPTFLTAGNYFENPVVSGGNLFWRSADGSDGYELWVSNGTAVGTHEVKDINTGSNWSYPAQITSLGNGKVVFSADDGTNGREIWVSDGTAAGTTMLADLAPGSDSSNPDKIVQVGSKVFFTASYFETGVGAHGTEWFVTDGTSAGTHLVTDLEPGSGSPGIYSYFAQGTTLYFAAFTSANGYHLYATDGTTTRIVTPGDGSTTGGPSNFIAADATHFFFTGDSGLFYSDGTNAGTVNIGSSRGYDGNFATYTNGHLLYRAYDDTNSYELWSTDGTAAGTHRVTDTLIPNSSNATGFTFSGGKVYFYADDGIHGGNELFVTDGTAAGTILLNDFNGASGTSYGSSFAFGGKYYFTAYDGSNGGWHTYVTDGTVAGTHTIVPGDGSSTGPAGNFIAADATHFYFTGDSGLFYSDGTNAGTINIGSSRNFDMNYATVANGHLLYRSYDDANGNELWITDGTVAGTHRVTDTLIPNSSNPTSFWFSGGKVYFYADDGVHGANELFVTDGTTAGTMLLNDFNGAGGTSYGASFTFGGKYYFTAYDPSNGGWHTYVTSGTVASTHVITPTDGSATGAAGNFLQADATHFFFTGDAGLFYSDGTDAGTHLVGDTRGYANASVSNGHLYYQHYDDTNGYELWTSDGTVAGTIRLTDTQIPNSSNPTGFSPVDNSPPTVTNAGTSAITDQQTIKAFQTVIIGDTDVPAQTLTVTITPDDAAKGGFTTASLTASGFIPGGVGGSYTFTGTAAQATAAIDALVYQPTQNRLVVGNSEAITYTIAISDGFGGSVVNHQTIVTQTSANDAPVGVANSAPVNEDATVAATTRATGVLANDTDADVGETATLKVTGAHSGAAADTAVGASGTTTIHGIYGDLLIAADGTYSYTPNTAAAEALPLGQAASDVFTYTVADVHGATGTATLTFNITGQEDGPVAVADTKAVNEDATASASTRATGLLANDTDVDTGEAATLKVTGAHFGAAANTAVASSGTTTIHGTYGDLLIAADGTYSYTPNNAAAEALPLGQAASDVFSYTIADAQGQTSTSTVTFNITGQNDTPVGVANSASVNEDGTVTASTRATGVLANDTDADTGETATLKVGGAHFGAAADTTVAASGNTTIHGTYGDLLIAADGTYSYTPNTAAAEALPQGQTASDVFSYTLVDVHGASSTATLTFNITGQEDGPVAVVDTKAVNEDATAAAGTRAAGLLANDNDVDTGEAATLKVTGAHFGAAANTAVASSGTTTIHGTYGDLLIAADGTYSYTPNTAAAEALPLGQAASDVFSYTIADAQGQTSTSTVTFNITGQNDTPVGVANSALVNEDATASASTRATGVLGNDTDADTGETATLKVAGAHVGAAADTVVASSGTTTIHGTYGDLLIAADGTYSYTPNTPAAEALTAGAAASDVFTYTVADAHGASSTATLTFNITGQEDGPVAVVDTKAVNEDATASAVTRATGLLANDTDVDSGETATLKVTGAHFGAAANTAVASSGTTAIHGTYGDLLIAADGTYSYTPNTAAAEALAQGTAASDVFSYTITDAQGQTSTSTVTFAITGQNDAPVAVADTKAVNEDATASASTRAAGVLGNDTDTDTGETATLKVTGAHFGATADTAVASSGTTAIHGAYGDLLIAADGTYSYTPNTATAEALPQGTAASDAFSYTITDAQGATATATLTFNIAGQNDAPVAVADTRALNEDATVTTSTRATGLLGNDTDADTGETATLKVTGAHGTSPTDTAVASSGSTTIVGSYGNLLLQADGTYSYTANKGAAEALTQGQAAADTFSYTITDAQGATSVSTLTFNITGQNDAPVATGETVAVNEDATVAAATRATGLLANDTDVDTGETATLKVTGAHAGAGVDTAVGSSGTTAIHGAYGDLLLAADGTYSYTPNTGAAEALPQGTAASDVFSYTIADAQGATRTATLTVNVTGQNDAPTATQASGLAATEQVPLDVKNKLSVADVDGGGTTESVTLSLSYGILHLAAGTSGATIAGNDSNSVTVTGTIAQINALLGSDATSVVQFIADTDTPPATATFNMAIIDSLGANGSSSTTIAITPVDDAAVAANDSNTVLANQTIVNASVTGNDHDVDGPALRVAQVNGSAGNVGTQITLGSGAHLTVNADGTYSYDPNHAFDTLTGSTGAANSAATDSFTYQLANGNTATVDITIQGNNAAVRANGTASDDTIGGTPNNDLMMLQGGGHDHVSGGAGDDGFYFGAAFDAQDVVDGGAGTKDQIGLQGDYSVGLTLGANSLTGVELLVFLPGNDTRFGDVAGNHYSYDITTVDGNVAAGQTLIVQANTLRPGENLTFDGSAEQDGSFSFFGGQGTDHLTGGQKDDAFYFGKDNRFDATDTVDGQGGNDQWRLQGDYSGANAVHLAPDQVKGVELILLASAQDTRFGAGGGVSFGYDLTLDDTTTAAGTTMTIQAARLLATESVRIDGSAETDGAFKMYTGAGNDVLIGGAKADFFWANAGDDRITGGGGADMIYGREGNDTFVYLSASDSTAAAADNLFDFASGDRIDVSAIGLNAFIGAGAFGNHAGEVRATFQTGDTWLVEGDTDGNGVADLSIFAHAGAGYAWSANDFVLAAGSSGGALASITPDDDRLIVSIAGLIDGTAQDVGADGTQIDYAPRHSDIVHLLDQHSL